MIKSHNKFKCMFYYNVCNEWAIEFPVSIFSAEKGLGWFLCAALAVLEGTL